MLILPSDEIHIWQFSLDQLADTSFLSPDEQTRAARLKIPQVRSRFMVGRVKLRQILSDYTGIQAPDLQFSYTAEGKPELNIPLPHLHFNLTHCDDYAMLAISHQPVGIDLERVRPLTGLEYIIGTAFTSSERTCLASFSEESKISAFFHLWTSKEAVMKALGGGFRLTNQIEFDLSDPEFPVLLSLPGDQSTNWMLISVPPPSGYLAALAVKIRDVKTLTDDPLTFHQSPVKLRLFNRD